MSIPAVAPEGRRPGQAGPMNVQGVSGLVNRVIAWADRLQREHGVLGFPYAVIKKYGDDGGGRQAALITADPGSPDGTPSPYPDPVKTNPEPHANAPRFCNSPSTGRYEARTGLTRPYGRVFGPGTCWFFRSSQTAPATAPRMITAPMAMNQVMMPKIAPIVP